MIDIKRTQADWNDYFKPFISTEDYIPDNVSSNRFGNFIFFILLGFITSIVLIMRVESKSNNNFNINQSSQMKIQKLKQEIKKVEMDNNLLESQILISNFDLAKFFEDKENYERVKLAELTGAIETSGEGVVIKLNDNNRPLKKGENPNFGIVHNIDLLNIVNYLWSGGAKAISINNIRIVNSSSIDCIGPTLLIDKTRIVPPFIIKAVGNPDNLEMSLNNSNIQGLELYGIKFSIDKYDKLKVPASGNIILAGDE